MGTQVETPTPTPSPEVKPAPTARGQGTGAGAQALAGGAPRVKCVEFEYRYTLRTGARTRHYVIDAESWKILKPVRRERSKSRAHGEDIYCLDEEVWRRTLIVVLKRSNSGRLYHRVYVDNPEIEEYARELEMMLMLCSDFEEMEETVKKFVDVKRLLRKDECEGEE